MENNAQRCWYKFLTALAIYSRAYQKKIQILVPYPVWFGLETSSHLLE